MVKPASNSKICAGGRVLVLSRKEKVDLVETNDAAWGVSIGWDLESLLERERGHGLRLQRAEASEE